MADKYHCKHFLVGMLLLAPLAMNATAAPSVMSEMTIASKVEEQGENTNLAVTDLRAVRRGSLLRIQAEVSNFGSGNQQLYYRFRWLDRDGFAVWDDEPWKPLIVYGRQKQIINVGSPTFSATDFRLVLQSPGDTAN